MTPARLEMLAIGAAVLGGGYLIYRTVQGGAGLLTGNNALVKNATDSNGKPVTAYQDKGVLGTLGAATNAVSGGYLATFGGWLGSTAYDLMHPSSGSTDTAGPVASYDETDRLSRRYPAIPSTGAESVFWPFSPTFSGGAGLGGGTVDGQPYTFSPI